MSDDKTTRTAKLSLAVARRRLWRLVGLMLQETVHRREPMRDVMEYRFWH